MQISRHPPITQQELSERVLKDAASIICMVPWSATALSHANTPTTIDKAAYLQLLRDKQIGGLPRILKFKSVTVIGSDASVLLDMCSTLDFQSFIQLIQDADGNWLLLANLPFVEQLWRVFCGMEVLLASAGITFCFE